MNIAKIVTVAVLAASFASPSFAGDGPGAGAGIQQEKAATEKSGEASLTKKTPSKAVSTGLVAVNANSEVFEDITIAAGQTYSMDSTLDYTSAATVAVTMECVACTTAATSLGSSGLVLQARWAVPGAEFFVTAESKAATAFSYWDAGSVLFNVYGTQFRLVLQNKGSASITIDQITLFQHSQ
ncbi:MAG: hypothetical protein ABSH56_00435 [Bryobacteraceae bacterium]